MRATIYQLEDSFTSTIRILENLKEHSEIKQDEYLLGLIKAIISEYKLLLNKFTLIKSDLHSLGEILEDVLPRHPNEIISATKYSYIDKYRKLKQYNCSATTINIIAEADGVEYLTRKTILHDLFNLSKNEVEDIVSTR